MYYFASGKRNFADQIRVRGLMETGLMIDRPERGSSFLPFFVKCSRPLPARRPRGSNHAETCRGGAAFPRLNTVVSTFNIRQRLAVTRTLWIETDSDGIATINFDVTLLTFTASAKCKFITNRHPFKRFRFCRGQSQGVRTPITISEYQQFFRNFSDMRRDIQFPFFPSARHIGGSIQHNIGAGMIHDKFTFAPQA